MKSWDKPVLSICIYSVLMMYKVNTLYFLIAFHNNQARKQKERRKLPLPGGNMVFILIGNSRIGVHLHSDLDYLIVLLKASG